MAFCVGVSSTNVSFIWLHSGNLIAGATSSALTLRNIQASDAGTYTVVASDSDGAQSASAVLTVASGLLLLSPGNLIVSRVGDGAQTLNDDPGNTFYLDQYTTMGTYVSTIMAPDSGPSVMSVAGGPVNGMFEGLLTSSTNGQYLNFAGYNAPPSSNQVSFDAYGIAYSVGAVNGLGYYVSCLNDPNLNAGGTQIRSVFSTDGLTNFWASGDQYIEYINASLGDVSLEILTGDNDLRMSSLFSGALYVTGGNQSGPGNDQPGLNRFGGLPTLPQIFWPVLSAGASSDPNDFAFSPDGATVYVADGNGVQNGGGIQRWDFVGTSWLLSYTLAPESSSLAGAFGLLVDFSAFTGGGAPGSGAVIYATTAGTSANDLITIVDTGPFSTPTTLANAGPNQLFRGVRFAPVSVPVSIVTPPQNQTNNFGTGTSLNVVAAGSLPLLYQWQFNGADIAGATLSSLTLSNLQVADSGSYGVLVTNAISSSAVVATLTVQSDTNVPVLLGARAIAFNEIQLTFSEPLTPASATNLASYSLTDANGNVTLSDAALDASQSNVVLSTAAMVGGATYLLTLSNLVNALDPSGAVLSVAQTNIAASAYAALGIGSPSLAGSQLLLTNGFDISAGGAGILGRSDQFQLSCQPWSGDFDLCVCVSALSLADIWSQAGLMARASLDPAAPFAATLATPSMEGVFFDYRFSTNGVAAGVGNFPVDFPNTWLRLKRAGSTFTGFASYDGQSWVALGTTVLAMQDPIYVGLAVSSFSTNQLTTASFANLLAVSTNLVVSASSNPHEPIGPSSRKSPIVVSEIMYKPAPRTDGNNIEFVELYNSNPWFQDISGYQITCADMNYTVPQGTVIPGGGYLVVAASPQGIQNVYGITNVIGPYNGNLKKSETLELLDEQGSILLTVPYSATYPWPAAADGTGHSLVLGNPSYGEGDPRAWDISDVVGGSPGQADIFRPSPLRNVVLNEVLAHSENPGVPQFVELYNHSLQAVDLSGCILTDNAAANQFVIPSGTVIPPAGFLSFTAQLGFTLNPAGDTIYFIKPDRSRVLDAVQFTGQADGISYGRWPDGANDFYALQALTPGTNNSPIIIGDIVINELMYKPISGSDDDQYIELYNKGSNTVSLANWQFTAGVTYTFPSSAVLPPNGYIVVAKNTANLLSKYPNLNSANTFGNYSGKLSHTGERVALSMPQSLFGTNTVYVVEDEVTYVKGGRWGKWSDGGGSSLELIDPHSNHRLPSNWADSDETQKSSWVDIEGTGVLDNGGSFGPSIDYVQIGLLDVGECLVDNIAVDWQGTNYIANSTFESGLDSWSLQGDHARSSLENSGYQSNFSLHMRSSDRMATGENSCVGLLNSNSMVPGATVTLRFKARWLRGWPEPLLRLSGNWLEATGVMPVPTNLGTPGAPNSAYVGNAGPAIYQVTHTPALPAASQPVVVTARVHDPDGVQSFSLYYRVDPAATYTQVPMTDDGTGGDAIAGDGIYSATIPGQSATTVVAFFLGAADNAGAGTRFPALLNNNAPPPECVVMFGDADTAGTFGVYHFWITQTNFNRWTDLGGLSREGNDMTFVYNNRVIYDASGEYTGTPYKTYTTPTGALTGYKFTFPADDMLLGTTDFEKLRPPGINPDADTSLQREQTAFTFYRALGLPWLNRRFVVLEINGSRRGILMEDTQVPGSDYVKQHFPNDDGGFLYKLEPWFEFAPQALGYAIAGVNVAWADLMPYTTTGGALKPARYRWNWTIKSTPDTDSDFTNIFSLVNAAGAYDTRCYAANMENLANMENWMRSFACIHAAGDWDEFGSQNGQNQYGYIGTQGTKFTLCMSDFACVLGSDNNASWAPGQNLFFVNPADFNTQDIYNCPVFLRMYWRAMEELINGPLNVANTAPLCNAKYAAFIANGLGVEDPNTALLPWISQAQASIASQLAAVDAGTFAVVPDVSVRNNVAYISGTAPVAVDAVWINGEAFPVVWSSLTNWTITVPLQPGTNQFTVTAVDSQGQPISGDAANISVTYTGTIPSPVGQVVINEIMYNPSVPNAQYVELYNNSSDVAFDLSGWQFQGLGYTFPQGSYIHPGCFLVLAANGPAFAGAYGATLPVFDTFTNPLPLSGPVTLALLQPQTSSNVVVAEVRYDSAPPWPSGADGLGSSLQLIDPAQDNWRVGNWSANFPPAALSPDATNTVLASLPPFPSLWINEVEPDNITGITNSAGQHAAWVELYNPSTNVISLDGLYLADDYANLTNWAFPSGAVINPRQFEVVFADGQSNLSTLSELHTSFALSSGSGSLALSRVVNGQPQVLDYIDYTNVPVNFSFGSLPDGQSFSRQEFPYPTPGGKNNGTLADFVPYYSLGSVYTQNFDSLPNPGATTVNTANPVTINGVTYSLDNPLNFAAPINATTPGGLGLLSTMPGWNGLAAIAMKAGASAGDQSTGGVISFGPTNSFATNRALGLLATSSTGPVAFGVQFVNLTSSTINQMSLSYTGELWRQQPTAKTLSFSYYIDLTGTNSFTTNATTPIPSLDVNFPTGVFTPEDGTQPANQVFLSQTNQTIADWPPGAALWLLWQMTNNAGTSQGLAIDNLSFSASSTYLPPTITTQPASQTVNSGNNASFSVVSSSASPVTYQWQFDNANVPAATNAILTLSDIASGSQGNYDVVVANPYGATTSAVAVLTVKIVTGVPVIETQPQTQSSLVGGSAAFTVLASGAPPLAFQWQFNGTAIAGATNATLVLSNLTIASQGSYSVRVSDASGATNSESAYLTVVALPPSILTQPSSQAANAGATVTLSVVAGGSPPLAYQWYFGQMPLGNGGPFAGSATSTLTISDIQSSDAGSYYVVVTNATGSITSQVATVVITSSYLAYTNAGAVYFQNFNSLPDPGASTVNTANPVTIDGVTYSLADPFDFAHPIESTGNGGLGLAGTMAGWYGWAGVEVKLGASAGDQTTGGVISFGPTTAASTNRSLGLLATSTTGPTAFALRILNQTGSILTNMNLSFTAELWRQQTSAKTISFSYFVDLSGTNAFSVSNVTAALPELDITFPTGSTASGATGPIFTSLLSLANQPLTNWPPGAALWLVWQMSSAAGSSQGLGIDDLSFSATGFAPALAIAQSGSSVIISWPATAAGYTLQDNTSDVSQPAAWLPVTQPIVVTNGRNTVTVPINAQFQFFRLKP
jgi:hypothetical protein